MEKNSHKLSKLQQSMLAKLQGGQFRYLNEKLYTQESELSFNEFQKDPSLFNAYHEGYRAQVLSWPVNPLSLIIQEVKKLSSSLVIADFGCGEAKLSESVQNKVFSFDLVSPSPNPNNIIACDIRKVPLENESVDISVFCLSLMGVNYQEFLIEATRVLKSGGRMFIAEVKSRFHDDGSKKWQQFLDFLTNTLGYSIEKRDESNKMFYFIILKKKHGKKEDSTVRNSIDTGSKKNKKRTNFVDGEQVRDSNKKMRSKDESSLDSSFPTLGACIYKRR
jgi:ribosomal RNA-processing protein 8